MSVPENTPRTVWRCQPVALATKQDEVLAMLRRPEGATVGLPTRYRHAGPCSHRRPAPNPFSPVLLRWATIAEPVGDRGNFPLGHFGRQLVLLLDGQCCLVQRVIVAPILRRQSVFQRPLDELAALSHRDIVFEALTSTLEDGSAVAW